MEENWLETVKEVCPRVHCITNYVTAQSVANLILAAGGSPIMASGPLEAADVTGISSSLVINMGTLDERTVPGMIEAGKKANSLGLPVIFDPVGVGSSRFRKQTALEILKRVSVTLIRGNGAEIRILLEALGGEEAAGNFPSCGIDAGKTDAVSPENAEEKAGIAVALAKAKGAVVVLTGEKDIVTDGDRMCYIANGHSWMASITGSGCMLDGLLGAVLGGWNEKRAASGQKAFSEKDREDCFQAAVWAVCAHGICGERAYRQCAASRRGKGSYPAAFIDAMGFLTDTDVAGEKKVEQGRKSQERRNTEEQGNTEERREKIRNALSLYAVTDRRFSKNQDEFFRQIEAAIKGGATMIQLREKGLPHEEFLQEALRVRELTRTYGIPLIINDNVEIALACGADGLHIGQEDLPAAEARKRLGPERILGVTAKSVDQAKEAWEAGADYLGSGAVFGSRTKKDAKGMDYPTLQNICRAVPIPVVAIGGITTENAELLAGSGIAGAAVVAGIFGQTDPEEAARRLREKIEIIKGTGKRE